MTFFSRATLFGVHHPILALLLGVVMTCLTAAGLPRLQVDMGLDRLISDVDPAKVQYDRIIKIFGSDNQTIIYFRDAKLWSLESLAALRQLHVDLASLPFVERVQSLFSANMARDANGKLLLGRVLENVTSMADVVRMQANATKNPLLVGNLLSKSDPSVTALVVTLREGLNEDQFDLKTFTAMEQSLDVARQKVQEVFQVGPSRISAELQQRLFGDLWRLTPLSALVLIVTLLFFWRSGLVAVIPLGVAALSLLWTFGCMGWAGIPVNIFTAMLPSLVLVIGSTESTYLLSAYLDRLEMEPEEKQRRATLFMLKHMGVPLLLNTLTTVMGFASNGFAEIAIIRDFAQVAACAIFVNGLITLMVVPMILVRFGPTTSPMVNAHSKRSRFFDRAIRFCLMVIQRAPNYVLLVFFCLCAFCVQGLLNLQVTNDPIAFFKKETPLVRQIGQIHQDLAGIKTFFITLESNQPETFKEPENIKKLVDIQQWLRFRGMFDSTLSVADFLALVNQESHGGDIAYNLVPNSREKIDQFLHIFPKELLQPFVNADFSKVNIIVRHNIGDSHTMNRLVAQLRQELIGLAGTRLTSHVVGENLLMHNAAENLIIGQIQSLGLLLVMLFILTALMFTSLKGGLVSLIANLIPIVILFGTLGLLGLPINPGTAIVAVIAIGITLDDTIHLLAKYNETRRRTTTNDQALFITMRSCLPPLLSTSLSLMLGFGVLAFSNFAIIAQFGLLAAAVMLVAVVSDLLVTPILMTRLRLVGLHQILSLRLQPDLLEKSPLFQEMSGYEIKRAILISEIYEFKQGDLLVERGGISRNMALILSGSVEVRVHRAKQERVVAVLTPGQIFGEIGFIMDTQRSADVRALEDGELLVFSFRKMQANMKYFPRLAVKLNLNISRILGDRLVEMLSKEETTI